ncbi:MAG: cell division protein FtsQ/DivIB [Burkholderiaceae bacterium]|jgi:cell division protein FtsQ|nr:cell division protein FtsQ/DivIB [Burkholderiaceae bacterium]
MARAATLPSPFSQQAAAAGVVLPADVRLMQATANTVLALVVLGLLAAGLQRLARAPIFNIQAIRIEGDVSRNSESTIRANAAPRLAGSFLTLDLQQARNAFEAVPWVRHAVVQRVWPGKLAVRLEEHQPVALWLGTDGNDRLVNTHGEVFEANIGDVEDDSLPRLQGPDGSAPAMLAMMKRLGPVLGGRRDGDLVQLELSDRGSWRATLDKGAVIELGRGTDDAVIERTQRFVQTLPRVEARYQRPLESADLRHADGFAVRLKGVTTSEPVPPARKK